MTEGQSFSKSAQRAGFAKGISKYHKLRNKSFQAKLEQFAPGYWTASHQAIALRAIPAINKAVDMMIDDPKIIIEKPTLLDRVARNAGLSSQDSTPSVQVINIKEIRAIVGEHLKVKGG